MSRPLGARVQAPVFRRPYRNPLGCASHHAHLAEPLARVALWRTSRVGDSLDAPPNRLQCRSALRCGLAGRGKQKTLAHSGGVHACPTEGPDCRQRSDTRAPINLALQSSPALRRLSPSINICGLKTLAALDDQRGKRFASRRFGGASSESPTVDASQPQPERVAPPNGRGAKRDRAGT